MSDINTPEITEAVRDALRLAGDRTYSQVKKSGSFLFKMKNTGEDIRKEFFDIYVFLLSDKTKAETAMQVLAGRNYKIKPEIKQLSFQEIEALEKNAYDFIRWSELIKEDDNPIPEEFRKLARLNERNQVALEYAAIAEHLEEKFKIVSYTGGNGSDGIDPDDSGSPDLYVYDDKLGIYSRDISVLKNEIERISKAVQYKGSVTTATREIFFYIAYSKPEKEYPFNKGKNHIPVNNGIIQLNLEGGDHVLIPNSPDHKFTFRVPIDYNPEADHEPIDTILKDYVHPDDLWYLYQIPAQCILQGFCECDTLRTAYLIQGPARGGKSTYCDLLVEYFFSPKFTSNECLQDLCGASRFCTYNLPGKFMNLYDDLDDLGVIKTVSSFKNLIGSYNQSVEKKGFQRKTEKISCVHAFTCNRPPLLNNKRIETDKAFWDRWVYLRFSDNEFKTDLKFKERNFTPENMSGFLNQVLKTVVDILTDSSKFRKQCFEDVIFNWDVASDPISSFVNDCYQDNTGRTMKFYKEKTLEAYKAYCTRMGIDDIHKIETKELLSRKLVDHGFKTHGRGKDKEVLYQASKYWIGPKEIPDPSYKPDVSQTDFDGA